MAGMSSRFGLAGYKKKKFMLSAGDRSVFYHAVFPFLQQKKEVTKYVFVTLESDKCEGWIEEQTKLLGMTNFEIIVIPSLTRGQAETAYLGLQESSENTNEPIVIMNIDTIIHTPELSKINVVLRDCFGVIDVAKLPGDGWSFAVPADEKSSEVARFVEKKRVSELASTGLYAFSSAAVFTSTYEHLNEDVTNSKLHGEHYISAVYQRMIEKKMSIRYNLNEGKISLCGLPVEYLDFCKSNGWLPDQG